MRNKRVFDPVKGVKAFIFLIAVSLLTACAQENNQQPALVVDVLAVARALGREEAMNQQLEQAKKTLNDQLVEISKKLKSQLEQKQRELDKAQGSNKQADKEAFDQMTQQANLQLNKARELANQKALQFRNQLIIDFRKEIMAVASKIATQRHASIIYTADSELLWYSDKVDITDEVIGKMRAQKEANELASEAAMPQKSGSEKSADQMSGSGNAGASSTEKTNNTGQPATGE